MTSTWRSLPRDVEWTSFPVSNSGCGRRSADARPNRMPETSDTPSAKSKTRTSIVACSSRGMPSGAMETNMRSRSWANQHPPRPPSTPSSRLSVSACRAKRERVAPRAVRTANSRARLVARARSRFATLVHATSSTARTAPRRTHEAARESCICRSRRERTRNDTS